MSENCVKISQGAYKKLHDFQISYGTAKTQFGECFMALHEDGVCFLNFFNGYLSFLDQLRKLFPRAILKQDDDLIRANVERLFKDGGENPKIILKGTDFQINVWEELLNIPKGTTCCYEDVAKAIGNPRAVRAVASAIAKNNVSYLVPCHRVISKNGSLNKYGGGVNRKLNLLRYEKAM